MCSDIVSSCFLCFNDTATTEIYTLSLHDALPIFIGLIQARAGWRTWAALASAPWYVLWKVGVQARAALSVRRNQRSEEHTSELQSRKYLVCRLLLEKKTK